MDARIDYTISPTAPKKNSLYFDTENFSFKLFDGSVWQGINADLVKGLPADFTANKVANGYQKLPSGLIIQWGGDVSVDATTTVTVTFPIAFPTACLNVQATDAYSGDTNAPAVKSANYTATTFTIYNPDSTVRFYRWLAIGY